MMRRKLKRACLKTLRQTFGVPDFRPGQKTAVSALLSGRDILCILPTGAGKSLCWQLPAVMREGLTVVVSPLIALMQDQLQSLRRKGIPAVTMNSLMTAGERAEAERLIRTGEARILFVSPERLDRPAMLTLCRDCQPWLLVVDEAHCVVQWGEEFRPAYSRIGEFVQQLPRRPVLCAMTATADKGMQRQIAASLGMHAHRRVTLPVLRENLRYQVRTTTDLNRAILRIVKEEPGRTVIFCRSRVRTERLAGLLRAAGYWAEHYHAGLDREARIRAQQRFQTGETTLLCATTAFGMGIDIPDIRCVIHDRLPDSVIDLVQQSGRAGRDGTPSDCIILLEPGDFVRWRDVLAAIYRSTRRRPIRRIRLMQKAWLPLKALLCVCLTERCIPAGIARRFGQRARPCGKCSACIRGRQTGSVPPLPYQDERSLRLWLLTWQRDAIARKRGVRPQQIISREAMYRAADSLTVPPMDDAEAFQAMARLMEAIRRAETNEKRTDGHPVNAEA